MMSTTHAAMGLVLASAVAVVDPALGTAAAVGAIAGGVFPDLDLAFAHRKTFHFPVLYWVPTVPALAVAALFPGPTTVGAAFFLLSAAVHSAVDVLGGDLQLRPWEATGDRGVYVHATGRWVRPRRWVRYDGAPEDLLLAAVLSIPALVVFDNWIRSVVLVGLVLSAGYALVRKRLVEFAPEWMQ